MKFKIFWAFYLIGFSQIIYSQSSIWLPEYVTLDDGVSGTGFLTASVAVISPNRFVALISAPPAGGTDIFTSSENYLVGYWDADSVRGRLLDQEYAPFQQKEVWQSGTDAIFFNGAWQITGGPENRIYVANNDENHNILVFQLSPNGVIPEKYRISTGNENIYAIAVAENGYVFVADFIGNNNKIDEIKIYPAIEKDENAWLPGDTTLQQPVATIDLPAGQFQGLAVNSRGTEVFVSHSSERKILKYNGSWDSGYTQDKSFRFDLADNDVVGDGGSGVPTFLGLAYSNLTDYLFAATDVFLSKGLDGAYPYGRIYVFENSTTSIIDTIDIAANNLARVGEYHRGSANGLAGGFASVYDVEVDTELSVYTQTYYGWAVEKWYYPLDIAGTGIDEATVMPQNFNLGQNYPNPFNPQTNIPFALDSDSHILLEVFDTLGRKVAVLVDDFLLKGTYSISFQAKKFPSGLYLYSLKTNASHQMKKMLLLR